MALPYSTVPRGATVQPTPFRVDIPEESLSDLKSLVKCARVARATYENSNTKREEYHGVSRQWMLDAKDLWVRKGGFDWREKEQYMNAFPHFTMPIKVVGRKEGMNIHFVALFSEKQGAVPLLLLHGWPGSFLEFLPLLSLLRSQYSPATLPYHVIVPSLPGFAFSGSPPLDRDFDLGDVAGLMDCLMGNLGFGDGYVAQGGDIGSKVARILGAKYSSCKAVHVNYCSMAEPSQPLGPLDALDEQAISRAAGFKKTAGAYAAEHATRASTIGLVLSTSPLALLVWIGEKFLEWTDENPELDVILESVTLYWLTETFPTSIYQYRQSLKSENAGGADNPNYYIHCPMGFSAFPKEIVPAPKAWVATTGNLVFYRRHDAGGHFAALEQPSVLLQDITEFVEQVWRRE